MTIIDALKTRSEKAGWFITREEWNRGHVTIDDISPNFAGIAVLPTNSPDGFVIVSSYSSPKAWNPTINDLLADDWIIAGW